MIYEKAFSASSLKKLHALTLDIISISKNDALKMACNSVVYKNFIVMNMGCSKALHRKLEKFGLTVKEVDLSEFLKAGGGAHCLSWRNGTP